MAWKISKAKRQALVKLQLRDKKGRWIEMGGGVKWYSSRLKKQVAGTVVGTKGENALVRLNKENPTHEPALVSVPARSITVVDSKASLAPNSKMGTPTDKTSAFEKPLAVANEANGAPKSNGYVKPTDSPEDWNVSVTSDGRAYVGRKDGAELYFPARSLEVGDVLVAPEGGDETKPFSIGKGWAKKGVESVNTKGPKTGTVLRIEGDRYAVVQLPDGFTVEDKKRPGEQTDLITVGLSNSVIKLTDGMKTALGDHLTDTFDGNAEEQEVDDSEEEQSDHVGREVPEEEVAAEERDPADVDLTDITDGEEEEKAAPITERAREIDVPQADNSGSDDQSLNENGLTDDEQKLVHAYDRMAQRAYDKFDDVNGDVYSANANRLRKLGEDRRAGAKADEGNPSDTPVKDPQNAPEATPEAPEAPKANVSLDDLEKQAKADGDTVLYHGGLPEGTTLDDIDLNRNGSQQNKRGRSFGGFYLTDESSKKWSEDYAEKRNGVMHGYVIDKNARIDDRGSEQIDRISAEDRAEAAKDFDVIKGKDLLGRTQYVLLNKDAVKGVGETNIKDDKSSEDSAPAEDAPQPEETAEAPNLEEPEAPAKQERVQGVLTPEILDSLPEGTVLRYHTSGGTGLLPTDNIDGKNVVLNGNAKKVNGKWSGPAADLDAEPVGRWKEAPTVQITDIPKEALSDRYISYVPLSQSIGGRPFDGDMDSIAPGDFITLKNGKKGPFSPKRDGSPAITTENDNGYRQLGIKAKDIDRVKKVASDPVASEVKEPDTTPEAPAAPKLVEPDAPESTPETAPEGYQPTPDQPYEFLGATMPTLFRQTVRGKARTELEFADETARESEYDQGYRMYQGKIEVYDFDRALSSLEDNIAPWYQYQEAIPTRENPNAHGYTAGHTKAQINAVVNGLEKLQEAIRAARDEREANKDDRFLNGYDINSDKAVRGLKKTDYEYAQQDYIVDEVSPDLLKALPEGSVVVTLDPEKYDANLDYVKIADNTWARSKGLGDRGWDIYTDNDMWGEPVETGIRLPDHEKAGYTERELNEARNAAEKKRRDDQAFNDNWNAHKADLEAKKAAESAPEPEPATTPNEGRDGTESGTPAEGRSVQEPSDRDGGSDNDPASEPDNRGLTQEEVDALPDDAIINRDGAALAKNDEGEWYPVAHFLETGEKDGLPSDMLDGTVTQPEGRKYGEDEFVPALNHYIKNSFKSVNDYIRNGNDPEASTPGYTDTVIDVMDDAIANSPLPEDTTFFRGLQISAGEAEKFTAGSIISDKGFTSVSADRDIAGTFAHQSSRMTGVPGPENSVPVVLEVNLPKGHNALAVDYSKVENESWSMQQESVLGRNSAFKVDSVEVSDDYGNKLYTLKVSPTDEVSAPEEQTETQSSTTNDGEPDAAVVSHLNENAVLGNDDERRAAGLYLGGARYNDALRNGNVPEGLQEQIDALTGFIDKQPEFGQEATLYRGMPGNYLENASDRVGEVVTEPAFMSTSLKRSEAAIFGGSSDGSGVIMELKARPEDKALSINAAYMTDQSGIPEEYRQPVDVTAREAEMLMKPNTSFKINGVEEREIDGRKYQYVQAEVVNSPEEQLNERGLTQAEEDQVEQHYIDADVEGRAGDDYGVDEYRAKAEEIIQRGQDRLNVTPEDEADLSDTRKRMEEAALSGDDKAGEEAAAEYIQLMEDIDKKNRGTYVGEEETSEETSEEAPDSGVHPLDELGIERRTPEAIAGEDYAPTQQQQDVIDAVLGGLDTKVQAMAGTGKTSTLVALSRRIGEKGGQAIYIAYNKTVQEEAERRMKGLPVEAKTGHGVAYQWALKNMPFLNVRVDGRDPLRPVAFDKNNKPKEYARKKALTSAGDVSYALGIKEGDVKEESGIPLTKSAIVLAVKKTVESYALSDSDTIQTSHVPDTFEIAEEHLPKIVEFANDYWADLSREDGDFRVTHDVYRKHWALSRPDLTDGSGGNKKGANILYIDEAQDTPPVLAKVVADQKMQKVIVGDANQAIYAFAQNIDYLSEADGDIELPLNKSWRFGPEVADAGNRFLQMLGSESRVIGGGGPSKVTYGMEDADAVLVRTNAGMIHAIVEETDRDRRVTAPKGTRSQLESMVETVEALMAGYAPESPHDDLIGFKNWEQVKGAYASGDKSLGKIVKLFDVVGNELRNMKPEDVERAKEAKMARAKKAIDHLVIDVPGFNTVRMVQRGDRTYLEPVEENPNPIEEDGTQKPWGGNAKKYAVANFAANLGKTRKPWLSERGLKFIDQQNKYRDEGGPKTVGWKQDRNWDYYTEDPEVVKKFATFGGVADVTVSTAHKSKGLEWDRVRVGDDFIGPYEDSKTGVMVWPEDDEYKLGYVALTRAAKEIDPGSLSYVFDYTQPNGGVPGQKKNEPTTEAAPEAVEEVAPEVVEDTAPEPQQIAEEPLLDATPDTDDVLDEAAKAAPSPVEETEDGEPVESPFYDDITGLTVDEEAHKDSLLAKVKEARQRGDWNTHGQLVKEVNKMFDMGRERWKAARDAEKQNEEPTPAPEPVVEAPEPEVTPEAPAPKIETPKPAPAPKKAPARIPAPAFDDDGLTPEEAARVANLEKWINDVYKGYGQGNVRKMENEVNDLLERGQKRLEGHPEAKLPVDITPEFETPAAVADAPAEGEAPSPVDGVSVAAPKPKKTPTGRKRGQSTVADANGDQIRVGDTITHKKHGPVTVTGVLPGAGRVNFIDPKTGKESSVKGDAISLKKDEAPAEAPMGILTGTPGDRLMDPNSGKKAFIGGDGLMIVTGQRVKDTKTGEIGIVQTVYTGADKKASVPVLFPGNSEPRRVRGTVLVHADNEGGENAPETLPEPSQAPEVAPEAPTAPEATPEAPEEAPEVAPEPVVVNDEKTERRRAALGNAPEGAEVRSKDGGEVYTKLTADFWENEDQTDSFTDDEVLDKILNGERDGKGYVIRTPRPEIVPEPEPEVVPEPEPEVEIGPAEPDTSLSGQALADTITYESTLHMTDGDLAEMMSRYVDDPVVFDKIMEVMDERDANVFLEVDTSKTGATLEDQPSLFDIPEPVATAAAAKSQKKLTPQQKASEEYQNYVMAQYFRAADELNGVLLNEAGKAHFNKQLAIDIFSGSVSVAHKYASEELLQWWRENGRETLASFRFGMYGWEQDRKAAQTARNLGYQRGSRDRDRSNF